MPIYEYRCERGHTFEVMQRMTDDALTVCDEHGTPVQRVFHPVAVHFKGSGFYNTDYGKKNSGAAGASSAGSSSEGSSSDSSSSKSDSDSSSGSSDSTKKDSSPTKSSSGSE
jgi:putative FmdB family regulatory protein